MATREEIKKALIQAFNTFDLDKSGSINASELKNVLSKFFQDTGKPVNQSDLDAKVQEFIVYVDKNKDGKIEQNEFVSFFEELLAKYN